jgi:type IV fimbrial biogenesis protein FimT
MITVVAVLGVIAAIAAPGMRSFAAGQKVKALSYDMTADLLLARSEALKRNATVSSDRQRRRLGVRMDCCCRRLSP